MILTYSILTCMCSSDEHEKKNFNLETRKLASILLLMTQNDNKLAWNFLLYVYENAFFFNAVKCISFLYQTLQKKQVLMKDETSWYQALVTWSLAVTKIAKITMRNYLLN